MYAKGAIQRKKIKSTGLALGKQSRVHTQSTLIHSFCFTLANLSQQTDTLLHVAQEQRVVEARHVVATELGNLEHLGQLVSVAGSEVQERESVKVLDALIAHLHNLVVALAERFLGQLDPALFLVHSLGCLQSNLNVATLQRQLESGLVLAYKVKRNLRVALLLQVRNDRLSHKVRVADDLKHLVVVALGQSLLEAVLGGVDGDGAGLAVAVEAVHVLALDAGKVDGLVQSADDAVVTNHIETESMDKYHTLTQNYNCSFSNNNKRETYPWGRAYLMWFRVE